MLECERRCRLKPRQRLGRGLSDLLKNPGVKVVREFAATPNLKITQIEYPAGYIPYEDEEQAAVVRWLDLERPEIPFFAVPNGARTSWGTAKKLKNTGLKAGVPDLVFPLARGGFHGFYLEMKRRKGGTVEPEQKAWHKRLEAEGYCVNVAKGADEAKAGILAYLACGPFTMGPPQ